MELLILTCLFDETCQPICETLDTFSNPGGVKIFNFDGQGFLGTQGTQGVDVSQPFLGERS